MTLNKVILQFVIVVALASGVLGYSQTQVDLMSVQHVPIHLDGYQAAIHDVVRALHQFLQGNYRRSLQQDYR